MRPAVRFGLIILLVSLLIAIAVSLYFLLNGWGLNKTMLVLPAVGVMVGLGFMLGGFGTYLNLDDEIENFENLVGDDIEELDTDNRVESQMKRTGRWKPVLLSSGVRVVKLR